MAFRNPVNPIIKIEVLHLHEMMIKFTLLSLHKDKIGSAGDSQFKDLAWTTKHCIRSPRTSGELFSLQTFTICRYL